MPRRIIPVASGKGGVGKTTFAINFALGLARSAPTVLVDLDTGTSSVRSTLHVPIAYDLYHFKRQRVPLAHCITRLDEAHDPRGQYRNFGFIAAPRHFIEDLANPDAEFRRQLAAEINRLPAEYVVLDLRAGLDPVVLDFLPFTNSGVLVFTPHHPAATAAAADIVKAILFRSLRILFGKGSPLWERDELRRYQDLVNHLLDRVEDVYDPALPNLEAFLLELEEAFGAHPILEVLRETLESFRVHYVLNMFNGVEESYQQALQPLVEDLAQTVSGRLNLTQLGWVVEDAKIHEANCTGFPVLLDRPAAKAQPAAPPVDRALAELESLQSTYLGLKRAPTRRAGASPGSRRAHGTDDLLASQLDTLRAMYSDRRKDSVRENFAYIVYRALSLMGPHMAATEFGETAIATPDQIRKWFLGREL